MATTKKKTGATIKLRRTGSPIRREADQRATLNGLGLTRANKVVELEDTSAVQGMVRKVRHLIEIVK